MKTICGYLEKKDELNTVASGGLVTAIARKVVFNNGIVFGVVYTEDFKGAQYTRVETLDDVELIKGTKYIRANMRLESGKELKEEIAGCLLEGRIVLFIGLPCEIYAVKRHLAACGVADQNLYTIDLVCHGPAVNEMHKAFIELLENRYKSKIISYNVRYKNPNWKPAFIRAEFASGQVYIEKLNDSEFGKAFNVCPQSCSYSCKFKGDNHCSDITVGDYWGISDQDKAYNSRGVSVGFVHTSKCGWLLNLENFVISEADERTALQGNPRYSTPLIKNPDADRFAEQFKTYGLEYASNNYMSMTTRIKRRIKRILRR